MHILIFFRPFFFHIPSFFFSDHFTENLKKNLSYRGMQRNDKIWVKSQYNPIFMKEWNQVCHRKRSLITQMITKTTQHLQYVHCLFLCKDFNKYIFWHLYISQTSELLFALHLLRQQLVSPCHISPILKSQNCRCNELHVTKR